MTKWLYILIMANAFPTRVTALPVCKTNGFLTWKSIETKLVGFNTDDDVNELIFNVFLYILFIYYIHICNFYEYF